VALSREAISWARIERSGLVRPFESPVAVASALVGVQSQFLPSTGLSIRNRVQGGFTARDLDAALQVRRDLLRLWGQRNTVHVYDPGDWATLTSVAAALPSYRARLTDRLGRSEEELGVALDRIAAILRATDRASSVDIVNADPTLAPWFASGNAVLMELVRRGLVCHAALVGGRSYFAHREAWMPGVRWDPLPTASAGAALARRYFATYGPATVQDFAFWLGAKVADARRWVASLGSDLSDTSGEGVAMLDVAGAEPALPAPTAGGDRPLRLLHRFDPLLLAHKDKSWIVDGERYKAVWRKAGYVEAVVLRRGRIAGTWRYDRTPKGVEIRLRPFGRLTRREVRSLGQDAESTAAYFAAPLTIVDFE
jgi:hypothetical protein